MCLKYEACLQISNYVTQTNQVLQQADSSILQDFIEGFSKESIPRVPLPFCSISKYCKELVKSVTLPFFGTVCGWGRDGMGYLVI